MKYGIVDQFLIATIHPLHLEILAINVTYLVPSGLDRPKVLFK